MAYNDLESLKKLSVPDPEIEEFFKANPLQPTDPSDVRTHRTAMSMLDQQTLAAIGNPEDVAQEYCNIEMRDGTTSQVKVQKGSESGGPLVLLSFGGGFVAGSREQLTMIAHTLVRLFDAVVVNSSYRLAPEHPFPTQAYDVFDTLKWCASNATALGANPEKGFIVGGISAGGNLSAVVSAMAREEKLSPPLTGQWLSVPVIFDTGVTVPEKHKHLYISREQNGVGPMLDKDAMQAFKQFSKWDETSPWFSPINNTVPLRDLPPAYIQVCGTDPIRDDGLIYESMLRENGVRTRLDVYPGCPHAYWALMPMLECSKKAGLDTFLGLGWLLGKKVEAEDVAVALGGKAA